MPSGTMVESWPLMPPGATSGSLALKQQGFVTIKGQAVCWYKLPPRDMPPKLCRTTHLLGILGELVLGSMRAGKLTPTSSHLWYSAHLPTPLLGSVVELALIA